MNLSKKRKNIKIYFVDIRNLMLNAINIIKYECAYRTIMESGIAGRI
jgi:hypothetical protein